MILNLKNIFKNKTNKKTSLNSSLAKAKEIKNFNFKKAGQTAMELALFGSILVFVVGLIVQTTVSAGYQQNQQLKAMRFAMTLSFIHSEGLGNPPAPEPGKNYGTGSRNSATLMLVEDRLTTSSGKYAAVDRTPLLISGSGTHSRNLFLPVEVGEWYSLPVMDVLVNGKWFVFRTSNFKGIDMPQPGDPNWDDQCIDVLGVPQGCPIFYKQLQNLPGYKDDVSEGLIRWCDDSAAYPCTTNLEVEDRFDLYRCGLDRPDDPRCSSPLVITDQTLREEFEWQWVGVKGVDENTESGGGMSLPITFLGRVREGIIFISPDSDQEEPPDEKNLSLDFDRDLKPEKLVAFADDSNGVMTSIIVIDSQEGDVDLTIGNNDDEQVSGFTKDVQMITQVNDGTYLYLQDGELFTPGMQHVRSVQRKDSVDIIQRGFKLAADTGSFCDLSTGWPKALANGMPNEVEVCCKDGVCPPFLFTSNCFSPTVADKTCIDRNNLMLWIRSRVKDLRGRKWISSFMDDPYVVFKK